MSKRTLLFFPALIAHMTPFRWTTWLHFLIVAFVFEGAARKWLLPSLSDLIYFSKDIIIFIMLCKYLHASKKAREFSRRDNAFHIVLLLLFTVLTLNCFNPYLGSSIIGIVGLRTWFLPAPLVYILQHGFKTRSSLYDFCLFFAKFIFPVTLVVLVQINSPIDAPINRYSNMEQMKEDRTVSAITVGEEKAMVVRATGTFSYIYGLSLYCGALFTLIVALYRYTLNRGDNNFFVNVMYLAMFLCTFLAALSSGSRDPIFYFGVFLVLRFGLFMLKGRVSISPQILGILLASAVLIYFPMYSMVEHWFVRVDNTSDTASRIFSEPSSLFKARTIFGYGTGRTLTSLESIVAKLDFERPVKVPVEYGDNHLSRIIIESGLLGLSLFVALKLIILFRTLQLFDTLQSRFLQELAAAGFIWHLVYFLSFPGANIQLSVIFWLFTAIIYSLPTVEQNALNSLRKRPRMKPGKGMMGPGGDSLITSDARSFIGGASAPSKITPRHPGKKKS